MLRTLCARNTLFMSEISEKIGRSPATTRWKAKKLGLWSKPEGRFAEWNVKHKHLREPVMRYFLKHTMKETQDHFGLTESEVKSIFTVGYRDPKFKHLRKDTRRRDSWTQDELLFLTRHAGVQPRTWIAKKLKRGTDESVKECLSRLKIGVRYMNGMPWTWAQELFGEEAAHLTIHTKAGPCGPTGHHGAADTRYRLLPWTEAHRLLEAGLTRPLLGKGRCRPDRRRRAERLQVSDETRIAIRALARFQRWIHGMQSSRGIRQRIQKAARRR